MRDYKKVCRCRDCGKIYDKGIPYICSKCGAGDLYLGFSLK